MPITTSPIVRSRMMVHLLFSSHVDFAWGWRFKSFSGPMYPGRERRGGNEGIAMVIAPFNNHIFHALEGLGFLWVKLLDPASLPPSPPSFFLTIDAPIWSGSPISTKSSFLSSRGMCRLWERNKSNHSRIASSILLFFVTDTT